MALTNHVMRGETSFGSRLGGDIGEILQGLAQQKAQGVKINQNRHFLNSLGIKPELSNQLAHHSDENIFKFLQQFEGFDIGGGQQPQQQMNPMQGLQQQPQQVKSSMQNQPNYPQQSMQNQPQGNQNDILRALSSNPAIANQINPEQIGQILQNQVSQQALNPSGTQPQQVQPKGIIPKATADRIAKEQLELKKQKYKESKSSKAKLEKEQKESKDYLKELNKEAHAAKNNNTRLSRMEELIQTGNLTNPSFFNALNTVAKGIWGLGLDLKNVQNPESQEFEKLSNDMIKGIKDIFGARITNLDVESFMKTIPTLGQSNEAKQRVINNLKIFNEGQIIKQNTAKDIIKQNNGVVPSDLELLVEEESGDKLDALAEVFKNQSSDKVPGTQRLVPNILRSIPNLFGG